MSASCPFKDEDIQVLRAVERFAFLRIKDLAQYLYLQSESSIRRIVKALHDEGYLSFTIDPYRAHVFAVTARGARVLRDAGFEDVTTTSKYLNQGNYDHRTLANEAVLRYADDPYCVLWTEYEIQRGKHALLYNFGKMPDALVLDVNEGYLWIEVERSKRNAKDKRALIRWLRLVTDSGEKGLKPLLTIDEPLWRIEFICGPNFEAWLRSEMGDDFVDEWCWFRDFDGNSY